MRKGDEKRTRAHLMEELEALRARVAELESNESGGKSAGESPSDDGDMAQKYLELVEVILVAIDRQGNVTLINRKGCGILGYEKSELLGKNWFDTCLPPNIREDVKSVFSRLVAGNVELVEYYENPVLTREGEERIIAWHNTVLTDRQGNITGTLSSGEDITLRKRGEKALAAERERLATTLGAIGDGVIATDRQGDVTLINRVAERYTGWSLADSMGKPLGEVFHIINEKTRVRCDDPVRLVFETGRTVGLANDTVLVSRDGTERIIADSGAPIKDRDGNVTGAVLVFRDVTLAKRAERELMEREKRFRDITENAMAWIWEVDAGGLYTYTSGVVEKILGYKPEEIVGKKHFYDLFHPEDREELKEGSFRAFEAKQAFREFVNRNVHRNGETVWLSTSGVPILDENGTLLGYRGADTDITDRKIAENEILDLKNFYESILEGIVNGVWVADANDVIYFANKGMGMIAGVHPEQIVGLRVLDDFAESTLKFFRSLYLKAKNILEPVFYDSIPVVMPAGRQSYQSGWLMPIVRDGLFNGMICTVDDVTEQRKAEEAIIRHRDELQQINEELKEAHREVTFYNDLLSHDIRNYANVASGYVQILLDRKIGKISDKAVELLEIVLRQMNRTAKLTEDVSILSRLRRMNRTALKSVDLHDAILSAKEWVKAATSGRSLRIDYHGQKGKYIYADLVISSILINLLDNSIKHNSSEEVRIGIRVEEEEREGGEFWRISISDNGDGIPDSYKGKIFDRYERRSNQEGIGLGLTLVKTAMDRFGGIVEVRDRVPGKHKEGAVFDLVLPKADSPGSECE